MRATTVTAHTAQRSATASCFGSGSRRRLRRGQSARGRCRERSPSAVRRPPPAARVAAASVSRVACRVSRVALAAAANARCFSERTSSRLGRCSSNFCRSYFFAKKFCHARSTVTGTDVFNKVNSRCFILVSILFKLPSDRGAHVGNMHRCPVEYLKLQKFIKESPLCY